MVSHENGSAPTSGAQPDTADEAISDKILHEAAEAHRGTDRLWNLLNAGQGEVDPLAAMIDVLDAINAKVDAIAAHLGVTTQAAREAF